VGLVTLYRVLLSPFLAPACRFEPSCSAYAVGALRGHGFCRGSWLTVKRLLRCRPGGGCGCDPVPPATRGVVLTVALAAGALAGLQVSPAAAEGPELELRSEDFVIKVDAYHGAFRSITLLDPQFAQAEREPEAGIPPERLAAGPLELVTTWDGPFLPLQLHFTRLDPEPEVRRLLHRDMRAVFARAPEGALLARLGPLTGVEAQSAPISPGDLLVPVGGTAAIAKIEKAVSRDLYSLGAVGATELPAEGSTLKVDILRVGPFSQVFASDPRFEPVEAPNGVLRLAWPHPTRDKSDLRIERLYRVSGHYRLEHILRLHWAGAGVLKHQEDFALFGWAGAHMEEPSLLNPTPEVIQPVCGVGSSVEHADREIPGFTQFDSSDWAGIERRYFLLGVAVEVPGGPQGKALPQCLVKVGPISLLTAILHPVGDRLTASPRSTCRPAYVTGEGPSCEDLLESLGLDQFATAEDARRASGTLSLDERKSLVSVLDSDVRATVFAGPKDIEALEEAGHNYQAAMDFGILSPISKPLL